MLNKEETKQRFVNDIKGHTMEVRIDNGVYRHLTFTNKGSSVYRFDIHTWPGYLCVCGVMGTYVFSRVNDMFEFFNDDIDKEYAINPGYWGEKLQAADKDRGHDSNGWEEFSEEKFAANVKNEVDMVAEQYHTHAQDIVE